MSTTATCRRLALALLAGLSPIVLGAAATVVVIPVTSAYAQVSGEFQAALDAYGAWRRHARWGEVWVPDRRPRDWRPYSVGHWVYTDDWGWFWVSDEDEADWGWVTYHYGRWIFERRIGWFWVPGEEWGPAWVDWRRGEQYVGWAPLPPDDVITEYEGDAATWIFVEPRYMAEPRLRSHFLPSQKTVSVLRSTVIVNRTFHSGGRIAVNPGISPALIGAAARRPIPTFRVAPRVLASTQGVSGAVAVRPQDLRSRSAPRGPNPTPAIAVQRTTTVIQPAASVPKPEPLGKGERGRLGSNPPRAAQGGGGAPQQQPQAPAVAPPATVAPPRPASPAGTTVPTVRQGEPPAQAKPVRPLAPQTPPPPPPAQSGGRPQPPTVAHPPPPPHPVAPPPAVRPAAPPPPKPAVPPKPGEKKPEEKK